MTDPFSIEKERKEKNDSLNNECHTKAFQRDNRPGCDAHH